MALNLGDQLKSNIDYGKKLVRSGLEGAAAGRQEFLEGASLSPFLGEAARKAWKPAALGACVGLMTGYLVRRQKPAGKALVFGAIGAIIGFSSGFSWSSRRLASSIGHSAVKRVNAARDERWLERNPIDYA